MSADSSHIAGCVRSPYGKKALVKLCRAIAMRSSDPLPGVDMRKVTTNTEMDGLPTRMVRVSPGWWWPLSCDHTACSGPIAKSDSCGVTAPKGEKREKRALVRDVLSRPGCLQVHEHLGNTLRAMEMDDDNHAKVKVASFLNRLLVRSYSFWSQLCL